MLSLLWFIITHPLDIVDCILCLYLEGRSYLRGEKPERSRQMTFAERLEEFKAKKRQNGHDE